MGNLNDLIGRRCAVVFDLPDTEWPVPGYPAFVIIESVEMPLIEMRSIHAGKQIWINARFIKQIRLWGTDGTKTMS